MIPDRLPWRHRARPSATLHEIQVHFAIKLKSGLVATMLQKVGGGVKGKILIRRPFPLTEIKIPRGEDGASSSVPFRGLLPFLLAAMK